MKTKLPPVRRLLSDGWAAAQRFPEAVLCGLVAGTAGAAGIDAADERFWFRICFAATLGLPLFVTLVLTGERRGWTDAWRWAARAGGAALLVAWWAASGGWQMNIIPVRFVHTALTLHLAAASLPYLGAREPWGFWQYNRALFFRFLVAVIYAAAVFVGVALAVAALDNLFGVDVPEETYGRLWFAAAFGLHPLVFLAGVPKEFASLNENRDYPKGLRIFSQNVMLPLVGLYVAILTTYLVKILITGTWPSGWVSYLVSALAVIGIFSLLMVHPERMRTERNWIDRYALGFWIAILYSAVMVLVALWQRIDQYGITEARYLLGVLAMWLAATALHRVITRTRDIKAIPTTLAVVGALTLAGPWSAYSVAKRSQLGRIEEILTTHGALSGNDLSSEPREIPFEEWRQVEDVTLYLVDNHGTGAFDRWTGGVGNGDEGWATEPALDWDGLKERIDGVVGRPTGSRGTTRRAARGESPRTALHRGLRPCGGARRRSRGDDRREHRALRPLGGRLGGRRDGGRQRVADVPGAVDGARASRQGSALGRRRAPGDGRHREGGGPGRGAGPGRCRGRAVHAVGAGLAARGGPGGRDGCHRHGSGRGPAPAKHAVGVGKAAQGAAGAILVASALALEVHVGVGKAAQGLRVAGVLACLP